MGAVRKKRTRETRKRKCGRWRGGPSRVFSTIRLKRKFERGYRTRVCVVKAVRNRADFTSYRAVIVVRKAESLELQEVGAIAAENRGLNETDRPRYAASFHLSVH